MIYGAMLAGGVGSRMKSAVIPKQFLEVEGKPIIIYTLQNMLKVDRFDYIYIATHKDYLAYMKEMVQKYTDKPEKVRIIAVSYTHLVKIINPTGLHLRPAGNLCKEAMKYNSKITFEYSGNTANAKSVLSVLGACIKSGDEITLICDGEDEQGALRELVAYVESGLGE